MSGVIYRYEILVDGEWHSIEMRGDVVHVGCRKDNVVEFWSLVHPGALPAKRAFRVFGTGHTLPLGLRHVGTTISTSKLFAWHLFEDEGQR